MWKEKNCVKEKSIIKMKMGVNEKKNEEMKEINVDEIKKED